MDIKINKRVVWAIFISIFFMVFFISRVEWRHFSLIAGRLNIKHLITACVIFVLANLIRAFRFSKLDHTNNSLAQWWHINAFYNFITSTLPGGAGEAATAYLLKRFSRINMLRALRILLFARLMDLFALSVLFFIAALRLSSFTPYREAAIIVSGTLFFISSVSLLPSSERFILKLIQKLPGQSDFKKRVYEKISELIKIAQNQRRYHSYSSALFLSVLMTIFGGTAIHMVLLSFGADFTFIQSFYCYGIYAIFQIVPVQGIAGIGTQAAWWTLAINAAGYHADDSIAMGFTLYGTFYLFVTFMGLSSLLVWLKARMQR